MDEIDSAPRVSFLVEANRLMSEAIQQHVNYLQRLIDEHYFSVADHESECLDISPRGDSIIETLRKRYPKEGYYKPNPKNRRRK